MAPFSWSEKEESRKQDSQRPILSSVPMALECGGREKRWFLNQVWLVCLLLGCLVAALHLTASHSSYLSSSIGGWSSQGAEESRTLELVELKVDDRPTNSNTTGSPKKNGQKGRKRARVAICLVGGARAFELTGLSIKQHVLDVYNSSDIFLHVPLDDDAHKLTLLKDASRLVMAKVFTNDHVAESNEAREVLTGANSPNGIQGLLQYFRLVEGCLTMVSSYETKHKFRYDWIIRTRVDGYWSGPLQPLSTLNSNYYHVPYGSKFGGLNDRLGIGTQWTSRVALSRLSLIPKLHEHGYRFLNSEQAFKHQLDVSNVKVKFDNFRFCILTARKYAWPLSAWGVPVASIKSRGALNGAKCKPCHPVLSGDGAAVAIKQLDTGWGWINPVKDLQLCDSRHDLEPGWETMFDEMSGPRQAHVRQWISNRTEEQCIEEVYQFGQLWEVWDAPRPEVLCKRHVPELEKKVNSTELPGQA